jgi:hypothetical protein
MSQLGMGLMLAGRAAIAVSTMPEDIVEYYLTSSEDSSIAVGFSHIMELEMKAEGKVIATPIEQGSFASYNKVAEPTEIRALLAVEGSNADLQSVVERMFELKESTTLVNFVTPIREYQKYTLGNFSYQQAAEKGTNVLYVEFNLFEIKEVEPQYTDAKAAKPISAKKAKKPANTSTKDMGKQQPKPKSTFRLGEEKLAENKAAAATPYKQKVKELDNFAELMGQGKA